MGKQKITAFEHWRKLNNEGKTHLTYAEWASQQQDDNLFGDWKPKQTKEKSDG